MFKPVSSKVDFPKMEEEVLGFWRERRIFERSLEERKDAPLFVLYEGPPTANGSPGIHHVLSRVFKDVIPRYKTMRGYQAPRKGGWDTHGLPVELEVEKELGLTSKAQIEDYGVARFNERCRESVFRYVKEWEALTERVAFWLDMKNAYITFQNDYIETCWWIIKQLWDKGLIYKGLKVAPHCPRCVTTLSSHEVALGYKDDAIDPSVYVRFRLGKTQRAWSMWLCNTLQSQDARSVEQKLGWNRKKATWEKERPSLLVWTTTPWTLTANVALAVAPDAEYVLVQASSKTGVTERLILAKALLGQALEPGSWQILEKFSGQVLTDLSYEPLYPPKAEFVVSSGGINTRVVCADFVSMEDGTGIVHIAPAYGQEDFELAQHAALPVVHTVELDGKMLPNNRQWDGKFVKEADPMIMDDLERRGLLYRRGVIHHTYPFCWRCETPLLYYAKGSWYIKTTAVKERLIENNQKLNWYPEHIKDGRFGEWLRNNVDWAISRERYWGTPLPIWQCQSCGEYECIGGLGELKSKPGIDGLKEPLDLHRPFVDEVAFACQKCGATMKRVPEVIDCWFDSGAMPLAQWHYPFENESLLEDGRFPADYICEAVDQTRGWFYSLHALSTLLFDQPCYKNVICLGLVLDSKGEKMSKSRGNVVDPWTVINAHGADAVRWYLFTATPPGNARRFSAELVGEAVRKFFLPLWNTYSFFATYANIDKFDPRAAGEYMPISDLDRWITSELHRLVQNVDSLLENYNPTDAGRKIEGFVEVLSNWYVRRSRRRFWKSENDADKLSAYTTLYNCLVTLSKLMAPFTPFLAEELYRNLVCSVDENAPESVHLAAFPQADPSRVDDELAQATLLAMRVASLGRDARSRAGIKVRQPLEKLIVKMNTPQEEAQLRRFESVVMDELNVKGLEIHLREQPLLESDYSVVAEGSYTVALPRSIPPELKDEGLARELVHRIQLMRRSAGFQVTDRILTYYSGGDAVGRVFKAYATYIMQETLSERLVEGLPEPGAYVEKHKVDGNEVSLGVKKR